MAIRSKIQAGLNTFSPICESSPAPPPTTKSQRRRRTEPQTKRTSISATDPDIYKCLQQAKRVDIERGADDGKVIEVIEGLSGDEAVVASPTSAVSDGVAVEVVKAQAAAGP